MLKAKKELREYHSPVAKSHLSSYYVKSQKSNSPIRSTHVSFSKSQIIPNNTLSNFQSNSIIRWLGINLEKICTKVGHEKNRIQFICTNQNCSQYAQIGCSHCFLNYHQNHLNDKISIQDYCKEFKSKFKKFKLIISKIDPHNSFKTKIQKEIHNQFFKMKQTFSEEIDKLQSSINTQIDEQLNTNLVENELFNFVKTFENKNIYELNENEFKYTLEFMKNKSIEELENIQVEINQETERQREIVSSSWNSYYEQLKFNVLNELQKQLEFNFLNQDLHKEEDDKVLEQLKQSQKQNYFQLSSKNLNKSQEDSNNLNNLNNQTNQINLTNLNQILDKVELKQNKQLAQREQDKQRLINNFPYKIFSKNCQHIQQSNTIPIFQCCNQAYPCIKCHGFNYHPPKLTSPSQRYCMKCLRIYQVTFPQNIPVSCLACQKSDEAI